MIDKHLTHFQILNKHKQTTDRSFYPPYLLIFLSIHKKRAYTKWYYPLKVDSVKKPIKKFGMLHFTWRGFFMGKKGSKFRSYSEEWKQNAVQIYA